MKKLLFILMTGMLLTQACSYHYYYGYPATESAAAKRQPGGEHDKSAHSVVSKTQPTGKPAFEYDQSAPDIKKPVVKKAADNYDPTDYNTFAVYTGLHTVEQPADENALYDLYAIWCTKDATYLVKKDKMLWNERYFQNQSATYLRDSRTGEKYQLRKMWGLPTDETYWLHGVAGEWFCRVFEFPPLDPECAFIDIVYSKAPALEHIKGTTGWGRSKDVEFLSVKYLQENQPKMKYKETVIVK